MELIKFAGLWRGVESRMFLHIHVDWKKKKKKTLGHSPQICGVSFTWAVLILVATIFAIVDCDSFRLSFYFRVKCLSEYWNVGNRHWFWKWKLLYCSGKAGRYWDDCKWLQPTSYTVSFIPFFLHFKLYGRRWLKKKRI